MTKTLRRAIDRNNRPCDLCKSRKQGCKKLDDYTCIRCKRLKTKCTFEPKKCDNFILVSTVEGKKKPKGSAIKPSKSSFVVDTNKQKKINDVVPEGPTKNNQYLREDPLVSGFESRYLHHTLSRINSSPERSSNMEVFEQENASQDKSEPAIHESRWHSNLHEHKNSECKESELMSEVLNKYIFEFADKYGKQLLRVYFVFVNPFLPVISYDQFIFMMENEIGTCIEKYGSLLLGSIFVAASQYSFKDKNLEFQSEDIVEQLIEACYQLSLKEFLVAENDEEFNTTLLQSCLLQIPLRVSNITVMEDNDTIVVVSKLLAISQFLISRIGIKSHSLKNELNSSFKSRSYSIMRCYIWWVYYIEEKWFSILTVRPSVISEGSSEFAAELDNWPNLSFSAVKSLDEGKGKAYLNCDIQKIEKIHYVCWYYFREYLKLTSVCSQIIQYWYSIADTDMASDLSDCIVFLKNVIAQCGKFSESLNIWWDELPTAFKTASTQVPNISPDFTANPTLQVSLYVGRIMIFKILMKKFSSCLVFHKYYITESQSDLNIVEFKLLLSKIKVEVFSNYRRYLKTLSDLGESGFRSFWYPFLNYKLTFAFIFMLLLSNINDLEISIFNTNIESESYKTLRRIMSDYTLFLQKNSPNYKCLQLATGLSKAVPHLISGSEVIAWIDRYQKGGLLSRHGVGDVIFHRHEAFAKQYEVAERNMELEDLKLHSNNTSLVHELNSIIRDLDFSA